jgi:hypothetical protein
MIDKRKRKENKEHNTCKVKGNSEIIISRSEYILEVSVYALHLLYAPPWQVL